MLDLLHRMTPYSHPLSIGDVPTALTSRMELYTKEL